MNELETVKKRIRDYMNEAADYLACGGAKSFEEYHRIVGKIEALALIEREIIDTEALLLNE